MSGNVNNVVNPGFQKGLAQPAGWTWEANSRKVSWTMGEPEAASKKRTLSVTSDDPRGTGFFSQAVVVAPKQFYRVEVMVTCDLSADGEDCGFKLCAEPMIWKPKTGRKSRESIEEHPVRSTPLLHRSTSPTLIRTYFRAPANVRRLNISVGIDRATGSASIHDVGVIEIIEPDEESHILATPPPAQAVRTSKVAKRVRICSDTADEQPLTRILRLCLGERSVQTQRPKDFSITDRAADCLFLPDPTPPKAIRSLKSLFQLSEQRLVIISLSAFAKLAGKDVKLRRIDQPDDPTFAKVVFANHITTGFALHDVFAFGSKGRGPYSFRQDQLRNTKTFKSFCERNGLIAILASMCNRDATSGHPICLYRESDGGGLIVLDIDPIEAEASSFNEPALAMHLISNILGLSSPGIGQYTVPIAGGAMMRELIREMSARYDEWIVHDENVPSSEVTQQLVTLGREDSSFGLSLSSKPVIFIRSGLIPGDVESVYSVFVWLKNLLRRPPYECPYAQVLGAAFRFAWLPFSATWESRDGWARSTFRTPTNESVELEIEEGNVAALIDVISEPINQTRVALPRLDGAYSRFSAWLPKLFESFGPGENFTLGVSDQSSFSDRDHVRWHWEGPELQVASMAEVFSSELHQSVIRCGGQVARIAMPGGDADFVAHSIYRTNLAATLLEQVIGLQYGLIAVNRSRSPIQANGFAPIPPGDALIVRSDDAPLSRSLFQVG